MNHVKLGKQAKSSEFCYAKLDVFAGGGMVAGLLFWGTGGKSGLRRAGWSVTPTSCIQRLLASDVCSSGKCNRKQTAFGSAKGKGETVR